MIIACRHPRASLVPCSRIGCTMEQIRGCDVAPLVNAGAVTLTAQSCQSWAFAAAIRKGISQVSGGESHLAFASAKATPRLTDVERSTLAEVGKRLGRKLLDQVAVIC